MLQESTQQQSIRRRLIRSNQSNQRQFHSNQSKLKESNQIFQDKFVIARTQSKKIYIKSKMEIKTEIISTNDFKKETNICLKLQKSLNLRNKIRKGIYCSAKKGISKRSRKIAHLAEITTKLSRKGRTMNQAPSKEVCRLYKEKIKPEKESRGSYLLH